MKKSVAILIPLAVFSAFLGVWVAKSVQREREAPAAFVSAPQPEVQKIVISCAGDCTLGSDPRFSYAGSFHEKMEEKNHAYFFENVLPIFRDDALTFVNFEGTLTEETKRAEKAYTFKGPAHYAKILTEGSVEAVSLANNHTYDFLEKGFADTKEALDAENIAYAYQKAPLMLSVRAGETAKKADGTKEDGEIYIGIAAFSVWYDGADVRQSIKDAVASLREENADFVFVSCHWGLEGEHSPSAVQRAIGRYAIDVGADGVWGHHPHVIQGIERYKDKEIVYSMGNFCFGGNHNPKDKDCFIYQMELETIDGRLSGAWESRVVPCRISSQTHTNDYRPTPLSGEEKEAVLAKIKAYSAF